VGFYGLSLQRWARDLGHAAHHEARDVDEEGRRAMKTGTVVALVAAATLAAAPGVALAAPGQDLVAGSTQGIAFTPFGAFPSDVHVNATGDTLEGRGHTFARFYPGSPFPDSEIRGSVTCVNAVGNQAVVLVHIESSNSPVVPVGTLIWRKVIDNGQGANDPPDETGVMFAAGAFCPPVTTPMMTGPIDQGNFVVRDGP
jgi:hypothetical protein